MSGFKISPAAKKAVCIGVMCSCAYLAVYIARNILGSVSPQMIEDGVFLTEQVGTLSSIYFMSYAVGQLINGAIGDKIKAKYMISFGLFLAGVCNVVFSLGAGKSVIVGYAAYALTGFFLSMIYGPMTKVVAENTEPIYATRCSLGYTFSSFFGTPMAGILAVFLSWQGVFAVSSGALIVMSAVCFVVFTFFERRGVIEYGKYKKPENKGSVRLLFEHKIVKYTLISIITGIVRTSVVFWLPTYFSQYLGFTSETAAMIFSVVTFIISFNSFIAVFLYERLGSSMDKMNLLSFSVSALSFTALYVFRQPAVNIVIIVIAIMSSNWAASMLWSRYCPSLRDTGMVSGATGFLDFMSYMAAAVSSSLFANAVGTIGWTKLILVWLGLEVFGIIVALPVWDKVKKHG
ncbi:MAG: MFS transporter [Ruminococcaceae bacterium]|nr:MFS transporter [Oscillospiraceae bacterium]